MVDNNTKSATSSPLGVSSFFFEKRFAELQTEELVIENTTVATKNSFICLRTDTSAVIRIDYIKIINKVDSLCLLPNLKLGAYFDYILYHIKQILYLNFISLVL